MATERAYLMMIAVKARDGWSFRGDKVVLDASPEEDYDTVTAGQVAADLETALRGQMFDVNYDVTAVVPVKDGKRPT